MCINHHQSHFEAHTNKMIDHFGNWQALFKLHTGGIFKSLIVLSY